MLRPEINRHLADLDAAFGALWDIWHDPVSGLWWAAITTAPVIKLAADTPEGLAVLLADVTRLARDGEQ
jgi:hypothetical protein